MKIVTFSRCQRRELGAFTYASIGNLPGIADQTWPGYLIRRSVSFQNQTRIEEPMSEAEMLEVYPKNKVNISCSEQNREQIKIILEDGQSCEVQKVQGQEKSEYEKHCISLQQNLSQNICSLRYSCLILLLLGGNQRPGESSLRSFR